MIHQAFEEVIIVLHCIIICLKLQSFDHKTKHLNIILLKLIIGRYWVMTDIHMNFV